MAFQKGKSGNPGGRKSDKPFAEALRMQIAAAGPDQKKLRAIADKLLKMAEDGDMQAINAVADRLDGKPAQESSVTVQRVTAKELPDDELAAIAIGSGEGDTSPPIDPSQLN